MFRLSNHKLWKGLMQNKIARHAPKIHTNKNQFFNLNKQVNVKYHNASIPQIKNAFHMSAFTNSNPNIGGSNIRVGKRTGAQYNGRSAIRKFKKVQTREVDPLTVYLPFVGYKNDGRPKRRVLILYLT